MNKTFLVTFSVSVLVLFSVVVISLMLLVPQQVSVVEANINKYEGITKSNYTYEKTKDINEDAIIKEYTITAEDLKSFKQKHQYETNKSDPFSIFVEEETGENTENGTTGSNANNQTTNSNGGVPNPPATSK